MTQYSDQVEKRRKESLEERMDKTLTCYYFQKHESEDIEDYRQIDYASGRRVITNISKAGRPKTTQTEPMRRWLFETFFAK